MITGGTLLLKVIESGLARTVAESQQQGDTIACAAERHNSSKRRHGSRGRLVLRAAFGLLAAAAGCANSTPPPVAVPIWELATARPVRFFELARARVSFDRPLPPSIALRLSDEFTVVTVRSRREWGDLRQRLGISGPDILDFEHGMVLGILATAGEPLDREWPAQISEVRARDGLGWMDVKFQAGIYYPLRTAGYLELAYTPGVHDLLVVRLNQRVFLLPREEPPG